MDAARTIIVAKVAELGLSLSELSLSVGKNHAYFQQFIKRGVPARLPEEVRGRVAEILKIDERTLKLGAAKPSPAAPGANAHVGGAVRITTGFRSTGRPWAARTVNSSSTAIRLPKCWRRPPWRAFREPMRFTWSAT